MLGAAILTNSLTKYDGLPEIGRSDQRLQAFCLLFTAHGPHPYAIRRILAHPYHLGVCTGYSLHFALQTVGGFQVSKSARL